MYKFTKITFSIALILLVYGYLSRMLNIFFFWESRNFAWIMLFVALAFYLGNLHKSRKRQGKKTIWVKIGIGMLSVSLILIPFMVVMIKDSDAYHAAIEYLETNEEIKKEVGNVKGFGWIPTGEVQSTTFNGAESGSATFKLTIKGDKRFKDITVDIKKTPETSWQVVYID